MINYNRTREFNTLIDAVRACTVCERMCDSARVLGAASGSLTARAMFIGEAPGRLGADATEIPFHGDKAGTNFEDLLRLSGISRYDIFVTNAVLCNPRSVGGNNATPTGAEIVNCSKFLRNQIELIDPRIVVTLGTVALKALQYLEPHSLTLSTDVRKEFRWLGRSLVPLYHPGQRAMIHRSFANQLSDYHFVAEILRRLDDRKRVSSAPTKLDVASVAETLLERAGEVSYFALHKLYYLTEIEFFRRHDRRMTSAFFIRQKDGPYCTDLHISRLQKTLRHLRIRRVDDQLRLSISRNLFRSVRTSELPHEILTCAELVASKYGKMKNEQLKTRVYLTKPMRALLREERIVGSATFNRPIMFA